MANLKTAIRLQMDLVPEGIKNVLVYAETREDREKAIGWLTQLLPLIELLEAELRKLAN